MSHRTRLLLVVGAACISAQAGAQAAENTEEEPPSGTSARHVRSAEAALFQTENESVEQQAEAEIQQGAPVVSGTGALGAPIREPRMRLLYGGDLFAGGVASGRDLPTAFMWSLAIRLGLQLSPTFAVYASLRVGVLARRVGAAAVELVPAADLLFERTARHREVIDSAFAAGIGFAHRGGRYVPMLRLRLAAGPSLWTDLPETGRVRALGVSVDAGLGYTARAGYLLMVSATILPLDITRHCVRRVGHCGRERSSRAQ